MTTLQLRTSRQRVAVELGRCVRVTLPPSRQFVLRVELAAQRVQAELAQRARAEVAEFATVANVVYAVRYHGAIVTYQGAPVTVSSVGLQGNIMPDIATLGYQLSRALDPYTEPQNSVLTRALSSPPSSPVPDARYLVGAAATDEWTGHEQHIATFDSQTLQWRFRAPTEGTSLWVDDEDVHLTWDGALWRAQDNRPRYIVDETVSALRVVRLSTAADGGSTAHVVIARLPEPEALTPLGITAQAATAGGAVQVVTSGRITDAAWNWQVGKPVVLGDVGVLTQTLAPGALYVVPIARAVAADTIDVRIGTPIRLAG